MRKTLLFVLLVIIYTVTNAQTITGTIKDEKGKPVSAVSVMVRNSNTGTSTDSLGMFKINASIPFVLQISSIGYESISVKVNDHSPLTIVLKTDSKSLNNVSVNSKLNDPRAHTSEVIKNQQTASTLHDYKASEDLTYGPHVIEHIGERSSNQNVHYLSTAPTGNLYRGAAIPTFTHKEETKGSRYLFDKWVKGEVYTKDGKVVRNELFGYNYDKITKALLLLQDPQTVIDVDRDQYASFKLQDENKTYTFTYVSLIDKQNPVQVLVEKSGQYSLYKQVVTKFEKANYVTSGLTESGHNYDEYIDDAKYYVVFPDNQYKEISLKKKSIKQMLGTNPRVDVYFTTYKNSDMDESFLQGLIQFLNQ